VCGERKTSSSGSQPYAEKFPFFSRKEMEMGSSWNCTWGMAEHGGNWALLRPQGLSPVVGVDTGERRPSRLAPRAARPRESSGDAATSAKRAGARGVKGRERLGRLGQAMAMASGPPTCATRGEEGDGEWRGEAHHGRMMTMAWAQRTTTTALGERDESDGFEHELTRGVGMGKRERSSRAGA
jgi:hypothetical protein